MSLTFEIPWSESNRVKSGTTFTTIAALNKVLRHISRDAPAGGPYHKTDIVIRDEAGDVVYEARFDVTREGDDTDLIQHLEEQVAFYRTAKGKKIAQDLSLDLDTTINQYEALIARLKGHP